MPPSNALCTSVSRPSSLISKVYPIIHYGAVLATRTAHDGQHPSRRGGWLSAVVPPPVKARWYRVLGRSIYCCSLLTGLGLQNALLELFPCIFLWRALRYVLRVLAINERTSRTEYTGIWSDWENMQMHEAFYYRLFAVWIEALKV